MQDLFHYAFGRRAIDRAADASTDRRYATQTSSITRRRHSCLLFVACITHNAFDFRPVFCL